MNVGSDPMSKGFEGRLARLRRWVWSHRLALAASGVALVVVFFGVWRVSAYRMGVEKRLSAQVNGLAKKAASVEQDEEGAALLAEETLKEVKSGLLSVHSRGPKTKNGLRALFLLANLEFKDGNLDDAMNHYGVVASKRRHYAAPLALYGTALVHLERGEHGPAIEVLAAFESLYHDHYLKGEVYLLRGLLFEATEQYTEAKRTYESMLNVGLELYKTEALNAIRLMEARGYISPSAN